MIGHNFRVILTVNGKQGISSLSPIPQAVHMTIPSRNALGIKLPSKKSNFKKKKQDQALLFALLLNQAELAITENAVDSFK